MNHSTLVGAVGSSNMCQGTQEESHSPVYPGISRQTSVQDGTNRAANLLQPLSRGQEKAWRIHWADTHSQERNFRSPAYLRKDSSTSLKERESECSQDNKNFTNTSLPLPPPMATLHGADLSGSGEFSCRKKGEWWVTKDAGHSWRNLFLSSSTKRTKVEPPWLGGERRSGNGQVRLSKGIKGNIVSRKSIHKPLGVPQPGLSLPSPQAPPTPWGLNPYLPPLCNWLLVHSQVWRQEKASVDGECA